MSLGSGVLDKPSQSQAWRHQRRQRDQDYGSSFPAETAQITFVLRNLEIWPGVGGKYYGWIMRRLHWRWSSFTAQLWGVRCCLWWLSSHVPSVWQPWHPRERETWSPTGCKQSTPDAMGHSEPAGLSWELMMQNKIFCIYFIVTLWAMILTRVGRRSMGVCPTGQQGGTAEAWFRGAFSLLGMWGPLVLTQGGRR